jgi:tape measure domain-containing protein
MATDIKVVKTVFSVDSTDIDEAKVKYNGLTTSIEKATTALKNQSTDAKTSVADLNKSINSVINRTNLLQSEYQKISNQASKTFDPKTLDIYKQKMQALQSEAKELGVKLTDTNKQTEKLKSGIGGIGNAIAGAFAVGSIISFGKSVLDATVKNEQLTKSFEVMLKSKAQADILMAQLVQFAKTTPFELTEVAEATKKLLAFGIASSDIKSTLTKLGDVSAGIGAPLSEVAYLFGTIKTQGRAMTQDINQFTNRGIPMWDELAKVTGISGLALKKYVEEGKIGYKEIDQAFTNLTTNGGKFTGLMEAQSKTLGGTISNLGDSWDQFMVKLGNGNSGILKSIVSTLGEVVDKLNEWAETEEDAVKSLAEKKSRAVQKYVEDDYKKFIELGKKNGIDERTAIEERYNNQTQLKSDLLTKQQEKLEELELKRNKHANRIGDGLLVERLSEIAKLEYGAEQDRLDNLVISQKAEIEKTKLHQKILEDVKKKHFEDIAKVEEGETKKQREARLKEQKQRVDDALNLLQHEENIAKQKALNVGANTTDILMIEDEFNYKRIQIYNEYSKILNNKQKQDQETAIVNVDTLATKIVESDKKLIEERKKANDEWSKNTQDSHEKNKQDLEKHLDRVASIEQNKIGLEKDAKLTKMYEDGNLTVKEKLQKRQEIEDYYANWSANQQIESDEIKLKSLKLNSEDYIALERKIADEKVALNKEANEKILEDDKATAEKRKEVTKQGLALLEEGINAVYSYKKNVNDQELIDLKDKEERELKLAGDNQAKKEAIAKKYEALQAEVRRKQFEQNKQIALINVAINTAEAISKANPNIPLMAFAGASGLIQATLINSQPTPKFAKGVIDLQGKGTGTSDEIHAMLSKGESVMTAEETTRFKPLLQSIRRKELSPELANMMLNGQKISNINLNTDSLARELRGMPKNHISIDKDGFKTFLYSENLKQESLNNRYLS